MNNKKQKGECWDIFELPTNTQLCSMCLNYITNKMNHKRNKEFNVNECHCQNKKPEEKGHFYLTCKLCKELGEQHEYHYDANKGYTNNLNDHYKLHVQPNSTKFNSD